MGKVLSIILLFFSVILNAQLVKIPNYITYIINDHTNNGSSSSSIFTPVNTVDTTFGEHWIEFDFINPTVINEYYITGEFDFHLIEARNSEEDDWTILTEVDTANSTIFSFINNTEYRYYQFRLTENNISGIDKIESINLYKGSSILPVEYSTINATYQNGDVLLEWHTITELNNSHFIIEKSKDAISFEEVETIKAQNIDLSSYSFLDYSSTTKYYRIKQVDIDGTFSYSEIIEIESSIIQPFAMVSEDRIDLYLQNITDDYITIMIINSAGEIYFSQNIEQLENHVTDIINIDLNDYSTGYYILKVIGNHTKQTEKFLVN